MQRKVFDSELRMSPICLQLNRTVSPCILQVAAAFDRMLVQRDETVMRIFMIVLLVSRKCNRAHRERRFQ